MTPIIVCYLTVWCQAVLYMYEPFPHGTAHSFLLPVGPDSAGAHPPRVTPVFFFLILYVIVLALFSNPFLYGQAPTPRAHFCDSQA